MAGSIRKQIISVTERLRRRPHQFSFFQAVRLLLSQRSSCDAPQQPEAKPRVGRLGSVSNITEEPVRFKTHPALGFPPSEIVSLQPPDAERQAGTAAADEWGSSGLPSDGATKLEVSFWGLTGPAGALPNHYTQTVIDRVHAKDHAMRDFFDMFSHRQLSFFYRAWEKYFPAAGFEAGQWSGAPESDLLRETLLSIVGRGTSHVRNRLESADDALIYYGGLFVDRPTAESLRAMVADYLQLPTEVLSLFGQWLVLPPAERSRLGAEDGHCLLGVDTVVGGRTWDPSSKFRIQIGPVTWSEFESLMPTGDVLVRVCQFIRSYVSMEFDFDLQVILMADEIPACQFPSRSDDEPQKLPASVTPHLGWNTWLCSKPPSCDSADAVFHHDGSPTR